MLLILPDWSKEPMKGKDLEMLSFHTYPDAMLYSTCSGIVVNYYYSNNKI